MKASWQARLAAFAVKRRIKPALGDMVDIARVRHVFGATTLPAPLDDYVPIEAGTSTV